jgi:hypothetical protein
MNPKVIAPIALSLIFGCGRSGPVGFNIEPGTIIVSCHSGCERGMLFLSVTRNDFDGYEKDDPNRID